MESKPEKRTATELCHQMNRDYILDRRGWKKAFKKIIEGIDEDILNELEPIAQLIWFQKQCPDSDEINKDCVKHADKILCYKYNWMHKRVLVAAHNEDWAGVKRYKEKLQTRMHACLEYYEEDIDKLDILIHNKQSIGEGGYLAVANIFASDWAIACDLATNPVYHVPSLSQ